MGVRPLSPGRPGGPPCAGPAAELKEPLSVMRIQPACPVLPPCLVCSSHPTMGSQGSWRGTSTEAPVPGKVPHSLSNHPHSNPGRDATIICI